MDPWVVLAYVLLLLIGLVNIYSVTSEINQEGFHLSAITMKQLVWIGGAALIVLIISYTNVVFKLTDAQTYSFTLQSFDEAP